MIEPETFPLFLPIVNTSVSGVPLAVKPCTNPVAVVVVPFPNSPCKLNPVSHTVPSFNNIVVLIIPAFTYFTLLVSVTVLGKFTFVYFVAFAVLPVPILP